MITGLAYMLVDKEFIWGACYIYLDLLDWELASVARKRRFFRSWLVFYALCVLVVLLLPFLSFELSQFHLSVLYLVSMRFWICILSYTRCISLCK